jgi:hypothetical protein
MTAARDPMTEKPKSPDVHVMPNDDKHIDSKDCPCGPYEDPDTKRLHALGLSARLWIHNKLGH